MNYLQSSPIIVPKLCYSHPKRQVYFQIIDARFEKNIVNCRLSCLVQIIATSLFNSRATDDGAEDVSRTRR